MIGVAVIAGAAGLMLSAAQYSAEALGEHMALASAVAATIYAFDVATTNSRPARVITAGALLAATYSYHIPIFTDWAVSFLTDLAIIAFVISEESNGLRTKE